MNKERELLERALSMIDSAYESKKALLLCDDINELLAQPEQAEQEPTTLSDKERQEAATEHRLKSMRGEK